MGQINAIDEGLFLALQPTPVAAIHCNASYATKGAKKFVDTTLALAVKKERPSLRTPLAHLFYGEMP